MRTIRKLILAFRLWADPRMGYTVRGALRTAGVIVRAAP